MQVIRILKIFSQVTETERERERERESEREKKSE